MIIKVTSTQSFDENGKRPYYIKDISTLPKSERQQYIKHLKENHAAGLLKMEVIKK